MYVCALQREIPLITFSNKNPDLRTLQRAAAVCLLLFVSVLKTLHTDYKKYEWHSYVHVCILVCMYMCLSTFAL